MFNSRKDLSPFLSSGKKPTKEGDKLEEFEEKEQRKIKSKTLGRRLNST